MGPALTQALATLERLHLPLRGRVNDPGDVVVRSLEDLTPLADGLSEAVEALLTAPPAPAWDDSDELRARAALVLYERALANMRVVVDSARASLQGAERSRVSAHEAARWCWHAAEHLTERASTAASTTP